MLNALQNIGPTEIIIGAIILVVIFGGKKLPEFAKGIGEAINTFKQALKGQTTDQK